MRRASFRLSLLGVSLLVLACGARSSDDGEYGFEDGSGVGGSGVGGSGVGGSGVGGAVTTGGRPGVGGGPGGAGGIPGTGGDPIGTGGTDFGNCCSVHGGIGCSDDATQNCVCFTGPPGGAADGFCCTNNWDITCVNEASACGACGGGAGGVAGVGGTVATGGQGGSPTGGATGTGGLINTGGVTSTGGTNSGGGGGIIGIGGAFPTGGTSGTGGAAGTCCSVHAKPGCNIPYVENCVCAGDDFCCNNNWDSLCVQEAQLCGGCVGQCVNPATECNACLCNDCYPYINQCLTGTGPLACLPLIVCSGSSNCNCP